MPRDPSNLDAYILGSGIASLTAAVHLIREAGVPPSRVHIIETLSVAGGTTRSYGDAENGYDFRAGMRPQFNDTCMDDLLFHVPSATHPARTVRDEVLDFARGLDINPWRDRDQTRFLTTKKKSVGRMDARKMGLGLRDRMEMVLLASKSEKALGRARICDCFSKGFFRTGYWLALATTFGLKPSHSAAEFRRYLQRFHNLHDLNDPHLLDLGKYNVHESIIAPIAHFLQSSGVDFRFDTTIADILFANDNPNDLSEPTRVTKIVTCPAGSGASDTGGSERSASIPKAETIIELYQDDIVIVNLGSIYSSIMSGSNNHAPPSFDTSSLSPNFDDADDPNASQITAELDENWLLWLELCTKHSKFGNAYNFCTRLHSSRLESFTITLSNDLFFSRLSELVGDRNKKDQLGRGNRPNQLLTLRDTPWLITLNIPLQPLFPSQPAHIQVCYGYALDPEKSGSCIQKPMLQCSGREIFTEILSHLHMHPMEPILESAITIPCIQPRAAATLLPRDPTDRPGIIPKGMTNMAVIGPFVEIPDEVVVTADYSVRGAQYAVRTLMEVQRENIVDGGSELKAGSGAETKRKKSKRDSAVSFLGLK